MSTPQPAHRPQHRSAARPIAAVAVLAVSVALAAAACSDGASPSPSSAPSASASASTLPGGDPSDLLAQSIPTQVDDVTLEVRSGQLSDLAGDIPNYDDLVLRLRNADVEPTDVLAAVGESPSGGSDLRVSGLTIVAPPPGGLGMYAVMEAWTESIEGTSSENTNVGGKPVVKVTFADGTPTLYYYLFDLVTTNAEPIDTTYFVRTADEALAADALSQLP